MEAGSADNWEVDLNGEVNWTSPTGILFFEVVHIEPVGPGENEIPVIIIENHENPHYNGIYFWSFSDKSSIFMQRR